MTIKKIKSVEQMLLEKELVHSGKYGHKAQASKKAYKRSKEKKEILKEIDADDYINH
jgi:hypothetical protein